MNKTSRKKRTKRIYGVVVAIVSDNVDPGGLGRVKVSFPWLDREDSYWARIATLMAGKERGSFFLPEVGDEVLIAFERGNLNHPYVIGALWNGKDTPPYKNAGENDIRAIKSRSGHELIFNDNDASPKIEIRTNAGHKILLDDSADGEKIIIADKTGDNTIELDALRGAISIKSQTSLKIEAQAIEITAGAMMTLKSNGNLTLQGAMVQIN